jgi:colanic acid/amylovoran biosynthesis glycosyltransferase
MDVATTPAGSGSAARPLDRLTVAHVVPEYLPLSATFIHTLLSHQARFRPLVLAERTSNLDEFPVERVVARESTGQPESRMSRLVDAAARRPSSAYGRWLTDQVERARCSLVHAHFGWSGRDAVQAQRRLGVPLVTTFYGRDLSEAQRARFRDPYARLFSAGSAFLVEGPAMADRLAAAGAPQARVRLVPIGIDLDGLPFADRAPSERFVALQAARFVEKKGFDLTLRAFARARPALGPSELWLVGDGPLQAELERLAEELRIQDAVRFLGLVTHDRLKSIAAEADVALQPSRVASDGDTEGGAPVAILEFQALGLPVIATRHADIPFIVPRPHELVEEEDVTGIADALVRVATEPPAARQHRIRQAREFVEQRHDARHVATVVEGIYDEVLA